MAHSSIDFLAARDGRRLRYGVFEPETPARQVCVQLSGQTEFFEKYREVIEELNGRGFTVATFDWRGQGGSQRALADPLRCHVDDFAEFDADLCCFMDEIVAKRTSTPPLVLAHSLGSHMAIRALHDHPGLFRAAILIAPMLDIATRGYPAWLTRAVTAFYNRTGKGEAFAWGMAARDPFLISFEQQLCTSDTARFERTQAFLRKHPNLRLAGPTWGWIEAAYRSMAATAAPGYAEAIRAPTLIIGAGKDRIVKTEATRRFAARLSAGRYVELADAEHEILMEQDPIRARFWAEFDAFVDATSAASAR